MKTRPGFCRFDLLGVAAALFLLSTASYAQSLHFQLGQSDYEVQQFLPPEFGTGEFTLEVSVLLDDSYPVGPCDGGGNQLNNWCSEDVEPDSSGDWWYRGNFLLDGHNNYGFGQGTFSLQIYGGGRVRWLFGDGELRAVQAYPADSTESLLDGAWHKIVAVRRYRSGSATLELYVDGSLISSTVAQQVNMRQWWNTWAGFPNMQEGWFWGSEKQAALGTLSQFEDFKGLIDDRKFFSRAKTAIEIAQENQALVGEIRHREGSGNQACDSITNICTRLFSMHWNSEDGPSKFATGGGSAPSPTAACGNGVDDDGDGLIDLGDPGCVSVDDDSEINQNDPSGGETLTADFENQLSNYPWIEASGWQRDTSGYGGNPTATIFPSNWQRFPAETASFSFATPQVLRSFDIATQSTGQIEITTDTESIVLPTTANLPETLTTGFSEPTKTITIGYVSGSFGIDNVVSFQQ